MSKSGWAAPIMSANARVIGAKSPPTLCPSWATFSRVNHIPKIPSAPSIFVGWQAPTSPTSLLELLSGTS
ncbi:hypothetical protein C0J52_20884 [Blattella germanica]|nr:hypothetical protein C0J52_20884 [Blattella germanica]